MRYTIALICVLAVTAVGARSLEGHDCREQVIPTGNPFQPLRTVRVCGAGQYADYLASLLNIQSPASRSLSTHSQIPIASRWYWNGFSGNNFAPTFYQPRPTYPGNWQTPPSELYERDHVAPSPTAPWLPYPYESTHRNLPAANQPSFVGNALDWRKPTEVDPMLQQQLISIVEDVSDIKDSVQHLVSYLKHVLNILLMQNQSEHTENNLSVSLKLGPNREVLLRRLLGLTEEKTAIGSFSSNEEQHDLINSLFGVSQTTANTAEKPSREEVEDGKDATEENYNLLQSMLENYLPTIDAADKSAEKTSTESVEDDNDSRENTSNPLQEHFGILYKSTTTEQTNTVEDFPDTEENNAEHETEETFEEGADPSMEDLENWLRLHFGPSVKTVNNEADVSEDGAEENMNQSSEEDGSDENQEDDLDESFETWFNSVYRRFPSVVADDERHSAENREEQKEDGGEWQEVNENAQEESSLKIVNSVEKLSELSNSDSDETNTNNNGNEYYDETEAVFVPTTMNPWHEDKVEYLENGDRYDYAKESDANEEEQALDEMKWIDLNDCYEILQSIETMENLDPVSLFNKCEEAKETFIRKGKSAVTDYTASKESNETEATSTDSTESKESNGTEATVADHTESKESNETEATVTDSTESKESNETEITESDSNDDYFEDYYSNLYNWKV